MSQAWTGDRAHVLFARARWNADDLGLAVARAVVALLVSAKELVVVAIDDTLFRRQGKKVLAASWFHDGFASHHDASHHDASHHDASHHDAEHAHERLGVNLDATDRRYRFHQCLDQGICPIGIMVISSLSAKTMTTWATSISAADGPNASD